MLGAEKDSIAGREAVAYADAAKVARLMFTLNAVLCASKIAAGWLGGSFALIADGVNNLSDVG